MILMKPKEKRMWFRKLQDFFFPYLKKEKIFFLTTGIKISRNSNTIKYYVSTKSQENKY